MRCLIDACSSAAMKLKTPFHSGEEWLDDKGILVADCGKAIRAMLPGCNIKMFVSWTDFEDPDLVMVEGRNGVDVSLELGMADGVIAIYWTDDPDCTHAVYHDRGEELFSRSIVMGIALYKRVITDIDLLAERVREEQDARALQYPA